MTGVQTCALPISKDLTGKLIIHLATGAEVTIGKKLAIILGLVDAAVDPHRPLTISETVTALHYVSFDRLIPPCVVLHCSIIEPSMKGAILDDALSIIPTQERSGGRGELIVHECGKLNYVHIKGDHHANMLISLKDLNGVPIEFTPCQEKVHVTLVFKDKK